MAFLCLILFLITAETNFFFISFTSSCNELSWKYKAFEYINFELWPGYFIDNYTLPIKSIPLNFQLYSVVLTVILGIALMFARQATLFHSKRGCNTVLTLALYG